MSDWGLMDNLYAAGCVTKENNLILRWADGKVLGTRPGSTWVRLQLPANDIDCKLLICSTVVERKVWSSMAVSYT